MIPLYCINDIDISFTSLKTIMKWELGSQITDGHEIGKSYFSAFFYSSSIVSRSIYSYEYDRAL